MSSDRLWAKRNERALLSKLTLPPELECMVLDTFRDLHKSEDLTWLWLGGRHVSKRFRSEIERIFRTVLLPDMILRCSHLLCWDVFTSHDSTYGSEFRDGSLHESSERGYGVVRFVLDRFSDDQTRAFLKWEKSTDERSKSIVFRRLHEKQVVGSSVFSIQVREVVNDTGLPELHIDDQKEEVFFDWKGMLDQLLGEEHVFNTVLSQRLGWRLDPKDTLKLLETHRKLARRSRLQRECRAKYGSHILEHYTRDEGPALKSAQRLRLAASGIERTHGRYDDDDHDVVYTKQDILNELPDDAIIYSGNSDPGPKPGSVPRGIFNDQYYDWRRNRGRGDLPPPSAADLFSPRPLPDLAIGRKRITSPHQIKREKRARENNPQGKSENSQNLLWSTSP
ncbi:hypothetical protein IMSHALPRED_004977 [Imshaugia aleurites]|uniref:Uncharacterized protein n=1 Tax=Imshaugia aleurites TaxID=172621 RepID=A0A8H3IP08_9LECA|nr:hypothetical protein IMSHALPRED_004977 [Imshaugia aleurites]